MPVKDFFLVIVMFYSKRRINLEIQKNMLFKSLESSKLYNTIFMENVVRTVDIGIHDYEIGNPQKVSFGIYVALEKFGKLSSDDIDQVLNYEYLIKILDSKIMVSRYSLLETLANDILDEVLLPTQVIGATVVLSKLDILDSGSIGCSITRMK